MKCIGPCTTAYLVPPECSAGEHYGNDSYRATVPLKVRHTPLTIIGRFLWVVFTLRPITSRADGLYVAQVPVPRCQANDQATVEVVLARRNLEDVEASLFLNLNVFVPVVDLHTGKPSGQLSSEQKSSYA